MSDGDPEKQFYDRNPFPPDLGAEGWEFPDVSGMGPAAAAKLWSDIEMAASEANKRAARLKERKAAARELALRAIEESPYSSVRVPLENGREVQMTPYEWEVFSITDAEAFKVWAEEYAAEGGEHFYDPEPKLREGVFLDEMRKFSQDKRPLPPGVSRYSETKISRNLVPQRRRKRQGGPGTEQGPVDDD